MVRRSAGAEKGRAKAFLRRRDLDIQRSWRQRRRLVALVTLGGFTVLVLLAAVFGEQGMLKVRHLNGERTDLEKRIVALEGQTKGLRQQVLGMQTDPFLYEKVARERLGMVKPGEVVYDFRDDFLTGDP